MKNAIDLNNCSQLMMCISNYLDLHSYFPQLDPSQRESLNELLDRVLKFSKDKKYLDFISNEYWKDIDLHMVSQSWGNTSAGGQTIGGAAMTSSYTTIIHNKWFGCIFVYYGTELAYIADCTDIETKSIIDKGYQFLPGLLGLKKLKISYSKQLK